MTYDPNCVRCRHARPGDPDHEHDRARDNTRTDDGAVSIIGGIDTEAERFFFEHAGYSYDPATETAEIGRVRCARELAAAEVWAREHEYTYDVPWDEDWATTATDEQRARLEAGETIYVGVVMYRPEYVGVVDSGMSRVVQSLWGIEIPNGPGTQVAENDYLRVVRAELAAEERAERENEEHKREETYRAELLTLVGAFEYERCESCGQDVSTHTIGPDVLGKPHAYCMRSATTMPDQTTNPTDKARGLLLLILVADESAPDDMPVLVESDAIDPRGLIEQAVELLGRDRPRATGGAGGSDTWTAKVAPEHVPERSGVWTQDHNGEWHEVSYVHDTGPFLSESAAIQAWIDGGPVECAGCGHHLWRETRPGLAARWAHMVVAQGDETCDNPRPCLLDDEGGEDEGLDDPEPDCAMCGESYPADDATFSDQLGDDVCVGCADRLGLLA